MLGLDDDEIDATGRGWSARIHPDDRESSRRSVNAAIDGEAAAYERELRLRHRDGSFRWFTSRGTIVRDAEGRPVRLLGTIAAIDPHRPAQSMPQGT
jgi:PAS domain S-box-containing protein